MPAPDKDCPECGGTGRVGNRYEPPHPPVFDRCLCALRGDLRLNCERAYKGLFEAPKISESPLFGKEGQDLWVKAGEEFLSHLRHVVIRKPPTWTCRVASDAQLTTAWLASVALQGKDILDADAYTVSTTHLTIPDLVMPPDLLVIKMGVKVTRNVAASECLAEALNLRFHESKPTWIWDNPLAPLETGHLFWSDAVSRILSQVEEVRSLEAPKSGKGTRTVNPASPSPKKMSGRKTLRGN